MKRDNTLVAYPNKTSQNKDNQSLEQASEASLDNQVGSVKFEVYGMEMLDKQVKQSGNSGRIYLPPHWVGKRVKIVRVD